MPEIYVVVVVRMVDVQQRVIFVIDWVASDVMYSLWAEIPLKH